MKIYKEQASIMQDNPMPESIKYLATKEGIYLDLGYKRGEGFYTKTLKTLMTRLLKINEDIVFVFVNSELSVDEIASIYNEIKDHIVIRECEVNSLEALKEFISHKPYVDASSDRTQMIYLFKNHFTDDPIILKFLDSLDIRENIICTRQLRCM